MHTFLLILQVASSILMTVSILMQPSKTQGLTNVISGGASDTFFSKNKSRTYEVLLVRMTIVCAILFAATTLALNLVK